MVLLGYMVSYSRMLLRSWWPSHGYGELFVGKFSESFWCSLSLTPSCRPVFPNIRFITTFTRNFIDHFTCLQIVLFVFGMNQQNFRVLVGLIAVEPCISSKSSGTFPQCLQDRGSPPSLCWGCHFVCWISFSYVVHSAFVVALCPWPT